MIFNPKNTVITDECFVFSGDVCAVANACIDTDIIKEFWHNFTFTCSSLSVTAADEYVFCVGNAAKLPLDGNEYSINVTNDGICVYAKDKESLLHGFMTLIDRFKAKDGDTGLCVTVGGCQIKDKPIISNRMIHFCIFPETELWELKRFVRLCGALRYTHIVLEFWGMLKYDCMAELAWPHAYTKDEVRPIVDEARALGMEVIPMFNHWGHASACRVIHGKHVVLDQNPALQTYFSEDGWCWDISQPKVRRLLSQVRRELIELCGDGGYFHIGCDEAYNFEFTNENMDALCKFINEVCDDMRALGRRIFIWGDMLLYRYAHYNPKNKYTCNAPSPEVEKYFLDRLDKDIIIADWQYHRCYAPIETCRVFTGGGFECILCPWDEAKEHTDATLETIKSESLFGFMHTTWHTLSLGMPYVTYMGVGGFEDISDYHRSAARTHTATLLRKVMPINGDYEKAGWSKFETSCRW